MIRKESEYKVFNGKFKVLEVIPQPPNALGTPIYAVLEVIDKNITIEHLSNEWIGRSVWLMQEARLNVIPETTLEHGIYFELKKRVNAGRFAFGD